MPVIAVVNRKGGCGKSTFAAHVAAWCARRGHSVMLGDVDRQQSSEPPPPQEAAMSRPVLRPAPPRPAVLQSAKDTMVLGSRLSTVLASVRPMNQQLRPQVTASLRVTGPGESMRLPE